VADSLSPAVHTQLRHSLQMLRQRPELVFGIREVLAEIAQAGREGGVMSCFQCEGGHGGEFGEIRRHGVDRRIENT